MSPNYLGGAADSSPGALCMANKSFKYIFSTMRCQMKGFASDVIDSLIPSVSLYVLKCKRTGLALWLWNVLHDNHNLKIKKNKSHDLPHPFSHHSIPGWLLCSKCRRELSNWDAWTEPSWPPLAASSACLLSRLLGWASSSPPSSWSWRVRTNLPCGCPQNGR